MSERWHEPEFTANWDRNIADSYPSRVLQVNLLVSLVSGLYRRGKWIADLGFGSGRVEEQIFRHQADAQVVGIDSSAAMINLARQRLAPWAAQYRAIQHELADIHSIKIPVSPVQIAISVQVLHHLAQNAQRTLHRWTYNILEPGGWYLIVDKRALADEDLEAYAIGWNALEQDPQWRTGRTFDDHLKHERE
jgi:tRNA (cmo5U34)-methyltransferase